jgi:dihydrofolate reductase
MELCLIAAVAANGVIGADGEMPWHYPADLEHFKETTVGHPVIMGRHTYRSILDFQGGPLPDRTNVVLSTTLDADQPGDVVVVRDPEAAVAAAAETGADRAYVIGGAAVYEVFLPRADAMLITRVPGRVEGDTHFPEFDDVEWTVVEERSISEELTVVRYER